MLQIFYNRKEVMNLNLKRHILMRSHRIKSLRLNIQMKPKAMGIVI